MKLDVANARTATMILVVSALQNLPLLVVIGYPHIGYLQVAVKL